MHVTDSVICAEYFPLTVDIVCNIDPINICEFQKKTVNLPYWRTSSELEKGAYQICTNEELSKTCFLTRELHCKQSNCTLHCKDIDVFYNDIFLALKTSGTKPKIEYYV